MIIMVDVQPTVFNPAQLYLLDLFSRIKSDEELNDIKQLVTDYYAKKVDELTRKMWESGELDQKRLDEIDKMDLHQWLREQKAKEQSASHKTDLASRFAGTRVDDQNERLDAALARFHGDWGGDKDPIEIARGLRQGPEMVRDVETW